MQLVITKFLERNPDEIQRSLDDAIPAALTAAAERIQSHAVAPHSEVTADGIVVHGLDILEGTEISWKGAPGLTTVRVVVPWVSEDAVSGEKLLAANCFAHVFSAEANATA